MEGAKRGKQIFLYLTNAITFFNSTLLWSFWSLKNPHWVVIQAHISYWKDYTFFNIFTIFLFFFFVFFAIDILFLQQFLTNDKWVWITIWWGFFKDQKDHKRVELKNVMALVRYRKICLPLFAPSILASCFPLPIFCLKKHLKLFLQPNLPESHPNFCSTS